eukprot:235239-Karenia_brevis.AAC.1
MDLVVSWPGTGTRYLIDATIRCQFAQRYERAHLVPGVAAGCGDADKHTRYGTEVRPLAFEAGGRLSEE